MKTCKFTVLKIKNAKNIFKNRYMEAKLRVANVDYLWVSGVIKKSVKKCRFQIENKIYTVNINRKKKKMLKLSWSPEPECSGAMFSLELEPEPEL